METKTINVDVIIDAEIFRKFMIFDYSYCKQGWRSPVFFALIMSVSALICFSLRNPTNQAVMLGGVLLFIGLGLPAFHVWSVFNSIKKLIAAYKLDKPQQTYSLQLSNEPDGIHISNPGGESAKYEWNKLYKVYRVSGCTYLYMIKTKAFILPDGQIEEGADALWSLFTEMLPKDKLLDKRRIRK